MVEIGKELELRLKQNLEKNPEGLMKELRAKYNVLTERDIVLCRLIMAGAQTYQIAQLLKLRLGSVKKTKHRPRKKLNMIPSTNWNKFFSEFR